MCHLAPHLKFLFLQHVFACCSWKRKVFLFFTAVQRTQNSGNNLLLLIPPRVHLSVCVCVWGEGVAGEAAVIDRASSANRQHNGSGSMQRAAGSGSRQQAANVSWQRQSAGANVLKICHWQQCTANNASPYSRKTENWKLTMKTVNSARILEKKWKGVQGMGKGKGKGKKRWGKPHGNSTYLSQQLSDRG